MKLTRKIVPVHMIRSFSNLAEVQESDKWLFDVSYVLFMLGNKRDALLYKLAETAKSEGCEYMYLRGEK